MDGTTKIAENTAMTAEITVTKAVNLVVTLEQKKVNFPVNFRVEPAGKAKLVVMEGSNTVNTGTEVEQGKKVTFTLSDVDPQYQVKSWMDGTTKIAENTAMTAEVTVTKAVEVVVTLEQKKPKFTVNFRVEPADKATLVAMEGSNTVNAGNEVEQGKKVTFTLSNVDPQYQVKSWMDGSTQIAENTAMNAEVTVTKAVEVVVTLEQKKPKFTVNFRVEPADKATLVAMEGSNTVNAGNEVEQGKKVTFTLSNVDPQYQVKSWMDGSTQIAENTAMNAEVTVTKAVEVVVTLEQK
ncbi:MAG: hypothetical protein ACTTKH_00630 [Treponema sp.]